MKVTLSVIKADVGSIGGYLRPSPALVDAVSKCVGERGKGTAFSGNVRGMGPAVAKLEIEERESEPVLLLAADKTDPGAYNLPLYLAFAYAMNTPGLMLAPAIGTEMRRQGFFGAAMLPMSELEYTGISAKLNSIAARFQVRSAGEQKGSHA